VAERVADGAAVMFVDHDPARLAGQVSELWRLDGTGQVGVAPGGVPWPTALPGRVAVIEVSGLDEPLARLCGLPGVLSVSRGAEGRAAPRVTSVRVVAEESDRLLRQLLARDGVHVTAVRADAGTSR